MEGTGKEKVPFTREYAKKCICWRCPVQADSSCVEKNAEKMGDVMTTNFFEPEIVPGLYCSTGTASCRDIDTSRPCICGECAVYSECSLEEGEPKHHFCKNGKAR